MTLYETIYARRQVREFLDTPLEQEIQDDILNFARKAEQLEGQSVTLKMVSASQVSNSQGAPCCLLAYCDPHAAAYANVGFVLQKADLYIQSLGLGSGWFMNIKPKENGNDFCIGLAVGRTELPMRKDVDEFKRKPISEINEQDNVITQAVRLAPSSLNSQPWEIRFEPYCIHVDDAGHGFSRLILKNKLNKIDVGIAARHAVVALENEGSSVTNVIPEENGKQFGLSIIYQ